MGLPNTIKTILTLFIMPFEYYSFFFLIYRCKRRNRLLFSVFLPTIIVLTFFTIHEVSHINIELLGLLSAYFCILSVFSLSLSESLKLFPVSFFIMSLLDSTGSFLFGTLFSLSSESIIPFTYMISVSVLWLFHLIVGKRLKNSSFEIRGRIWLSCLLFTGIITAAFTYYQFQVRFLSVNEEKNLIGVTFAGFGGLIIFVLYFVLLYNINSLQDYQKQLTESNLFNSWQRKYFEELLSKEKQTKKLRHDYIADLVVIQTFLTNQEYDKASEYIAQLRKLSYQIKGITYTVGNEVIDIILNYYLREIAGDTEITITGNAGLCNGISNRDITVIVSNLVKNAVEELSKTEASKRCFRFECTNHESELIIKTQNTCFPEKGSKQYQGSSFSRKGGNHLGIGLTNIEETVNKYNGVFFYRKTEALFETETRLPLNKTIRVTDTMIS